MTAPVETPVGLYFPGFGPDDANPDLGDSAIVETIGLGAVAIALTFRAPRTLVPALATPSAAR